MSAGATAQPRWVRFCVFLGVVLLVLSGLVIIGVSVLEERYQGRVVTADLFGDTGDFAPLAVATPGGTRVLSSESAPDVDLDGPLDLLLVGIDPRPNEEPRPPLADAIMVLHVDAAHEHAYLFSLPRDLIVDIPAFAKAGYRGGTGKINGAMAYGSRNRETGAIDNAQGFQLLARTVIDRTGIPRFEAGAILDFSGFEAVVDALGGVDMYVDERTLSIHRAPNGTLRPGWGPQKAYEVGEQHMSGWEALDFVRQRKSLAEGDYARQRHQQQFLKAVLTQATDSGLLTDPLRLDRVLRAAGESLTFSGRGHDLLDYVVALRHLRPDDLTMVRLPGASVGRGAGYRGEHLLPVADEFFAAVAAGRVAEYLSEHPELVS
ncbi:MULTISPECIES: LCP family protein [Catenuloplanes]|uniref:LCP family protein required for cell wall assembly n=1 Tax=Catenuloplanes niger TaxID=587534 RepID=A0AAE3ZRM9_9ACTN|nr:LCP family protein [Catenuloplanes niger]MDR7324667.1 LCP family protein required for cell wall assembly [Catenuloplanes niger]